MKNIVGALVTLLLMSTFVGCSTPREGVATISDASGAWRDANLDLISNADKDAHRVTLLVEGCVLTIQDGDRSFRLSTQIDSVFRNGFVALAMPMGNESVGDANDGCILVYLTHSDEARILVYPNIAEIRRHLRDQASGGNDVVREQLKYSVLLELHREARKR